MKYKYNNEWKEMNVKVSDTLPIGSVVDYDGDTIPAGWEEVEDTGTSTKIKKVSQPVAMVGSFESGSNENGNWIKYSDGTLICTGKLNIAYQTLNTWYDKTVNFPIPFIDTPYVTLGLNEQHRRINTTYRLENNSQIIIGFISQDGAGGSSNVSYIAIGKWK